MDSILYLSSKTTGFRLRTSLAYTLGALPVFLLRDHSLIYEFRKDATLKDLANYLRSLPPSALSLTLRHPAARFVFKVVFPDVTSRGRMTSKELGSVSAKDLVKGAQLSQLTAHEDSTMELDGPSGGPGEPETSGDPERSLDELRVVSGDFLLVAVHLPPKALGMSIAGAAGVTQSPLPNTLRGGFSRGSSANVGTSLGRGTTARGGVDPGWGRGRGTDLPQSGHWRGGARGAANSGPPGRGASRQQDRRPSPVGRERDRRASPTGRDRDQAGDNHRSRTRSRSVSRSRSRSPVHAKRD